MALLTGGNLTNVERVKITTVETTPVTSVFQTASAVKFDAAVSAGTEKEQRVKNAILGLIKTPDIVKGYDITLTDDRLITAIFALIDGGTEATGENPGYTGPVAGSEVTRKKFDLYVYTSDRGSDGAAIKYHEWKFPSCQGTPVSTGFTEGDFAKIDYKIESRPATGVAVMTMLEIASLPSVS